jgi:hypothetical protein
VQSAHASNINSVIMSDLTYFLCHHSPTAFPKKYAYEPYIRRFVPELKVQPIFHGML